jgi:hypothetical protein
MGCGGVGWDGWFVYGFAAGWWAGGIAVWCREVGGFWRGDGFGSGWNGRGREGVIMLGEYRAVLMDSTIPCKAGWEGLSASRLLSPVHHITERHL